MRLAKGFELDLVVSDTPELLAQTAARLTAELGGEGVARVALGPGDDDTDLLDRLGAAARPDAVQAVVLSCDVTLIDDTRVFVALEAGRASLPPACPKPVVLLLSLPALHELIRRAPELWAQRAGVLGLAPSPEGLAELLANISGEAGPDLPARRMAREVAMRVVEDLGENDQILESPALLRLARIEAHLGELDLAGRHYERALELAVDIGDELHELNCLTGLAETALARGEVERSAELYAQVLELASISGNRLTEGVGLLGFAALARYRGDNATAGERYERARTIAVEIANDNLEAHNLIGLANIAIDEDDYVRAIDCGARALQIATTIGDRTNEAHGRLALGLALALTDALPRAREHAVRAAELFDLLGLPERHAHAALLLGAIDELLKPPAALDDDDEPDQLRTK